MTVSEIVNLTLPEDGFTRTPITLPDKTVSEMPKTGLAEDVFIQMALPMLPVRY